MPFTRKEHWDTQHLHEHLKSSQSAPFVWGQNDCCLAAANAIESFTGVDLADDFRGKYDSEESAFALIKEVTGVENPSVADAAGYCATKHGLQEHQFPLFAKRGDLVVIQNGETKICGYVHLNGRQVISVSERGLVRLPITKVVRAWGV